MARAWFAVGAIAGATGVILGAFGAHLLRDRIASQDLAVFETGVRYHLVHAVALLAVSWATERWPGSWTMIAGWLLLAGIALFSGSLYVLAVTGARWLGAITPLGGVALVAGWISLAVGVLRRPPVG